MPIDPRIALGVQAPQIESPMNVMAKAMELQNMQRQNALFERQQAELMRKQQQEAALNAAYSNALTPEGRLDEGKLSNYLARAGAGSAIPGAMEALGKGREALSKANSAEFELAKTNSDYYNRAMLTESKRPGFNKERAASLIDLFVGMGVLNPQIAARAKANLPDDPAQLAEEAEAGARRTMTDEQILQAFSTKGVVTEVPGALMTTNPYTGQPIGEPVRTPLLTAAQEAQEARLGRARAPTTQFITTQEKAEQTRRGEFLAKNYESIATRADAGRRFLPTLEQAQRALNEGVRTGFGAETVRQGARVLAALGEPEAAAKAANADLFLAAAMENVLRRQIEQKGPQTESDAQRIEQTFIGLGKTPAANQFMLDVARAQINRDGKQKKFFDDWWRQNKTYDGAEEAWFEGAGAESLFDEPGLKKYGAAGAEAPAPPPGFRPDAPARR